MTDINTEYYWDKRYALGGNSGEGSYGIELKKRLKWLNGLPIESITDIGCGDFNFGYNLLKQYPKASYTGYDTSHIAVGLNKLNYKSYSFTTVFPQVGADLTLCMDVLFHVLDDVKYIFLLAKLREALKKGKYLALTAYENEQPTAPHLNIRKFDYKVFGKPLIREIAEKEGSKYFYLFKNENKTM